MKKFALFLYIHCAAAQDYQKEINDKIPLTQKHKGKVLNRRWKNTDDTDKKIYTDYA